MKLFGKDRILSPQWRLRLHVLLGNLSVVAVGWLLVANSDSIVSRAPLTVRMALFALWSIVSYIWLMNRRTPDKTALKPRWWKL